MLLAALLASLAVFLKHNLLSLPLAMLLWLLRQDRRAALRFLAASASFTALGLLICASLYGAEFLLQMLAPRSYSIGHGILRLLEWLAGGGVPLGFAIALALFGPPDRQLALCLTYVAVAIAIGGLFQGGAGIDSNIMFDANIALAVAAGLAIQPLPAVVRLSPRVTAFIPTVIAVLYAPPTAGWIVFSAGPEWLEAQPQRDEQAAAMSDIGALRAHPGPTLCQSLALCYWADRAGAVDVFNLTERHRIRLVTDMGLLGLLAERHFAMIQLKSIDPAGSRWPPAILGALRTDYRIAYSGRNGVFLVPR